MLAAALVIMIAVTGFQIGIREYRARQIARAVNYETAIEKLYFGNGKKSWSNGVKGIVDAIESL